ncbi:MAG TPA: tRNA (N(6)-L-threonylcarbamoyladenosine(37)-C(2))-methylthiotransferase MtaB [Candidatus Fimimorpha faecalis]|uniref:Threonylcarbamoyladenosine tRNA methylthiotransferase MtaB n=1 Tax=Candidatus Fimimorpha faecalis TaxID=2840824 RepID=A0A9D1ECM8_9FIRM|nr:tRNA (N(6)-L-threonylcarbamoyladenosine(37)-C(2))-methylthiotransferase MtaB [Candidatus Fimimorpha faecalis]
MSKKVAFHTLGCKVNTYETDAMEQMLLSHGYEIVSFENQADIYIINTCSVTNMADRKSRQMLHKAKKKNPNAVVVAAGCYVQAAPKEVLADAGVDLVIGNNRKQDLVQILEDYFKEHREEAVIDINKEQEYEELELDFVSDHTRAYIKVQDGCNQFCSYCIIPYTRGRVRSRAKQDVISEIKRIAKNGTKEVVLTGIHLSSYGKDLKDGTDLLDLIKAVHEVDGIQRIRLGSLEPRIITLEFAQELRKLDKFCPHFHLSLQSGCEATLKRMNRHYTPEEYYEKCELLREVFEHPAITTDVIVGFPGETEEEFEETYKFLEKVNFYEMHVFKYSKRKGTRAAEMENQVPEPIKTKRSNILLELTRECSKRYRSFWIGREVNVLLEEKIVLDGEVYTVGHTKEYVKAAVKGEFSSNTFITGKINGFLNEEIVNLLAE